MPQASKKRRRQAHGLAAEGLTDAPRVLDQPSSLQTHHLTAASLTAGKSPPPGRTAQEKEFANFLIGTISASPSRRTISKEEILSVATRRFGLSERRAKAFREDVIDYLDASACPRLGRRQAGHIGAPEANFYDFKIVTPIIAENVCDRGHRARE